MAEIINLNKARKAKLRVEKSARAEETKPHLADAKRRVDFIKMMRYGEQGAEDLRKALSAASLDTKAAEAAYTRVASSCTSCHKAYRD